jgi:uncharacterized damage-inducible protein DinB
MIYNNVAEIYEAIDKTKAKLLSKFETLTEDQLNTRENGQGWSVAEIIEHLGITGGGITKVIEKFLSEAETKGSKSDGKFNPPLSFIEHAEKAKDKKFEAPERVRPQGAQDLSKSLTILRENQQKLKELQTRIEATDLSNTAFPHPAFGNLNLYQWLVFIGLHEQRHLAQIDRILTETD